MAVLSIIPQSWLQFINKIPDKHCAELNVVKGLITCGWLLFFTYWWYDVVCDVCSYSVCLFSWSYFISIVVHVIFLVVFLICVLLYFSVCGIKDFVVFLYGLCLFLFADLFILLLMVEKCDTWQREGRLTELEREGARVSGSVGQILENRFSFCQQTFLLLHIIAFSSQLHPLHPHGHTRERKGVREREQELESQQIA